MLMGYIPVVMFDLWTKYKIAPIADYPTGPGFVTKDDGGLGDRPRQAGQALDAFWAAGLATPAACRHLRSNPKRSASRMTVMTRSATNGSASVSLLSRLLSRPELGAAAGAVLVLVFFAVVAGDSGLFSAKGIVNFLEVSAQLGILAAPVALLMIAGEFDLSVGSMIGFAGILIAIPTVIWGWPIWLSLMLRLRRVRRASAISTAWSW